MSTALPGLDPTPAVPSPDIFVVLGDLPPHFADSAGFEHFHYGENRNDAGQPLLQILRARDARHYRIQYQDGTTFVVDAEGTHIWARWKSDLTLEDTATYLLGPVFAFVLRLRGTHSLHGSAVSVDGHAVAMLGPSGSGKSSTAAACARAGLPVLSDDLIAIADHGQSCGVMPAYPRVRLWSDSAESLFGDAQDLPLLTPTWDKRFLPLSGDHHFFETTERPLAMLYFFGERRANALAGCSFRRLDPKQALMNLLANNHADVFPDAANRALQFDLMARIAQGVDAWQVDTIDDVHQIQKVSDEIVMHARGQLA